MRLATTIIATHLAVAAVAWVNGYLCRVWLERRHRELDHLWSDTVEFDIVDLIEPDPPYDWATRLDSGVADPPSSWPGVITYTGHPPNGSVA